MDINVLITLTYVVSALNIETGWSVALMPIAILWKLQMPRKIKVAVIFVRGLGVFSSVATIVRLRHSSAYTASVDYLGKEYLIITSVTAPAWTLLLVT
jgi:hypothetical protein